MKAIVYTKYGTPDVLELKEVEKPTIKENEVLVKVYATTVTPMDWRFRNGKNIIARMMSGPIKPKNNILGVELAGEIESVGKDVKLFKEGDQVYGGGRCGAHAEYMCLSEEDVVIKPSNMNYEEAAAVPFSASTALQFLKDKGKIQSGHKVLVGKNSFSNCKSSLNQNGIYLSNVFTLPLLLQMLWTSKVGSKKAISMIVPRRTEDLIFLRDLIEAGKVKSVIDRCYPLSQTAEAHRYAEKGHAKGKVVLTL